MKHSGQLLLAIVFSGLTACSIAGIPKPTVQAEAPRRFFSDTSFWNTPIPEHAETDPRSYHFMSLLSAAEGEHFAGLNYQSWTVPVYAADASTPRRRVRQRVYTVDELRSTPDRRKFLHPHRALSQSKGFGKDVPIPDGAIPDPQRDHHLAIVDWSSDKAWDMWDARKLPDGDWESSTGMVYSLDGDGVFHPEDFDIAPGESIHFHGPSRASGVPLIAGLIMYDEVMAGKIRHKLSACTPVNAYQEYVYPAIRTDGQLEGGLPEGAVIQLDPKLDLSTFDLLPGELAVAKALQEYGVVVVDNGGDFSIYAEGLYAHPGKSWNGLFSNDGLARIPAHHYRVLKMDNILQGRSGAVSAILPH